MNLRGLGREINTVKDFWQWHNKFKLRATPISIQLDDMNGFQQYVPFF